MLDVYIWMADIYIWMADIYISMADIYIWMKDIYLWMSDIYIWMLVISTFFKNPIEQEAEEIISLNSLCRRFEIHIWGAVSVVTRRGNNANVFFHVRAQLFPLSTRRKTDHSGNYLCTGLLRWDPQFQTLNRGGGGLLVKMGCGDQGGELMRDLTYENEITLEMDKEDEKPVKNV